MRRETYYPYRSELHWYEFGHFVNDEWIIDKDSIFTNLKDESETKYIDICQHFTLTRLKNALNALPNKIIVTDSDDCEWEYKYRDAPLGMKQTEIIGIKPRIKRMSDLYDGFGISESTSFNNKNKVEEKDVITKNTSTVTFQDIGGIDDIIQQIREVIELPLIAPTIFEHYHIIPHKGILLYGPPGCGKNANC